MTPEGLLTIKQLLTHPCGVGPTWTNKLLEELIDAIVCVQEEKEEDKNG